MTTTICTVSFLSTLSLRRATTWARGSRVTYVISIHALLAESDTILREWLRQAYDFYPRSPCGERHGRYMDDFFLIHISIHALLAESDGVGYSAGRGFRDFYPRSPCGERRRKRRLKNNGFTISIHALLAESDVRRAMKTTVFSTFLSTLSLRRATVPYDIFVKQGIVFLSTLSLRRATCNVWRRSTASIISIHALLAESDVITYGGVVVAAVFLSTLSLRRATCIRRNRYEYGHFYPRSPCGERR